MPTELPSDPLGQEQLLGRGFIIREVAAVVDHFQPHVQALNGIRRVDDPAHLQWIGKKRLILLPNAVATFASPSGIYGPGLLPALR